MRQLFFRALVCFALIVPLGFGQPILAQRLEGQPGNALIDDVNTSKFPIAKTTDEVPPEIVKWEDDIRELEALDKTEEHPADAILFIGSSSIRRWTQIDRDMAPYRTIRRGYGGSKYRDVAHYAPRLISPHDYRALVLFVGNDVSGGEKDHTADQVERWVRSVLTVAKRHQPESPVFLVEVTPTPKRFGAWPAIMRLNTRLREITLTTPNTFFVSTAGHYLDTDKKPIESLFVEDRLHQNEDGYSLWSSLIRRRLDEVFRMQADVAK